MRSLSIGKNDLLREYEMLPQAEQIYKILVELAGAGDYRDQRDMFNNWFGGQYQDFSREFRFQGNLGFGGKFWRNDGRFYVNCYREDETPERLETIERTNEALSSLTPTEV